MTKLYELRVTLDGVAPPIWRVIQVPEDYTLGDLHEVLQTAMGWENCHLHQFESAGRIYTDTSIEPGSGDEDEDGVTVGQVLPRRGSKLSYVYDFGDDWSHSIEVVEILVSDDPIEHAICVDGNRACPPEDCLGPHGYMNMLRAQANPKTEEDQELAEWLGDDFDPEALDLAHINNALFALAEGVDFEDASA